MAGLAAHVEGWAPEPVQTSARLDRWPSDAFADVLDQPSPIRADGDPLPPLWHWFHFLDHPAQAELGEDGHPAAGHFLPPIPDRRRMFAGARLEVREPLRIGEEIVRRSALADVTPKQGRSGDMLFVTVRHEFLRDGSAAAVEEQDIVYRSQPVGEQRGGPPAQAPGPAEPEPVAAGAWRARLDPDPAMLFRFSALTYNTHRIHYDQPYVTGVEGYSGLVVHGPLLALLLLELPRRHAASRPVTGFSFRLSRPAFAGTPIVADGVPGHGCDVELAAGVPGQPPSITGTVRLG
ncbi:MaoC family dehydratase N-terminal domain-containing protein [Pseudonocardia sp. H11422]|uniref:FAS1-like dehydratase domain-containing protein n=1 Tax=Pseudonocardia sp. H11422 TaxID=2835866 RepID=UPI001BDDAF45|nr:MaoC family dehydratase N-terminal domain-containing protein [Pseudonocardia sp. H11422]